MEPGRVSQWYAAGFGRGGLWSAGKEILGAVKHARGWRIAEFDAGNGARRTMRAVQHSAPCMDIQSRRDYVLQPRVASIELPWVNRLARDFNPERVVTTPVFWSDR